LKKHLFDEQGKLRSFVNVYKNDEDVRYLEKGITPVADSDALSIIPSIAGGAPPAATVAAPAETGLSNEEIRRYSRHLIMPEVGMAGQEKLKAASGLLIGAGGLGSPAAIYLAAAGVGTLGIVDSDIVDESNLQRQVLHSTDRVGMPKVESARIAIHGLNPEVKVDEYNMRLTAENARDIISRYDILVDGADNFDTRYLLNDLSVEMDKPNVSASILSFDGQLTTFVPGEGPCYRCVYPEPPPPALAPT